MMPYTRKQLCTEIELHRKCIEYFASKGNWEASKQEYRIVEALERQLENVR